MTDPGGILILADEPVGSELSAQLSGEAQGHTDPYDALTALSAAQWSSVIVTAPRPDFASLCCAIRRLQADAELFGLCPPSEEPDIRALVPGVLDDYFIYPPTRGELSRVRRRRDPQADVPVATAAAAAPTPVLTPKDIAVLIDAASSPPALAEALAAVIAERLGAEVKWVPGDQAGGNAMLLDVDDHHRALVPADPDAIDETVAGPLLEALQAYLPALTDCARRSQTLHRLAITDHLTEAYNRRYFYHLTDQILARAAKRDLRASLLLFDIDNFKHYNDTYGHATGDSILKAITALMHGVTRSHDVVARIGGDEFAILFWDVDRPRDPDSLPPESSAVLADRFRRAVEQHEFPLLGPEATGVLTISGGLATFPRDGNSCRQLLAAADEALMASKSTGKNTITLIGSASSDPT